MKRRKGEKDENDEKSNGEDEKSNGEEKRRKRRKG